VNSATRFVFSICCLSMTLTVAACSATTAKNEGSHAGESLFENASIPIRAVVVTRAQKAYPLESLDILASPASVVAPLLKAAQQWHEQQVRDLQNKIVRTNDEKRTAEQRLIDKKNEVSDEYNRTKPNRGDIPPEWSRDRLKSLSAARAKKTDALRSTVSAIDDVIVPIEKEIENLTNECQRLERDLSSLRQKFDETVFGSLPSSPAKRWVTDSNGYATASIPRSEPWYFWGETTRDVPGFGTESYRWILTFPDDVDDAGKLFLDHRNLLDSNGLVIDADTGHLRRTSNVITNSVTQ